jgi:hypothetical protein
MMLRHKCNTSLYSKTITQKFVSVEFQITSHISIVRFTVHNCSFSKFGSFKDAYHSHVSPTARTPSRSSSCIPSYVWDEKRRKPWRFNWREWFMARLKSSFYVSWSEIQIPTASISIRKANLKPTMNIWDVISNSTETNFWVIVFEYNEVLHLCLNIIIIVVFLLMLVYGWIIYKMYLNAFLVVIWSRRYWRGQLCFMFVWEIY